MIVNDKISIAQQLVTRFFQGDFEAAVQQYSAVYEPPAYMDEDTFKEQEVQIGKGEWVLPGMLSMPVGNGPFAAVLLVHGSGPNDRDETIGPNKPFRSENTAHIALILHDNF